MGQTRLASTVRPGAWAPALILGLLCLLHPLAGQAQLAPYSFSVVTEPAEAKVFINGVYYGKTPVQVELPKEKRKSYVQLQITKQGYESVNLDYRDDGSKPQPVVLEIPLRTFKRNPVQTDMILELHRVRMDLENGDRIGRQGDKRLYWNDDFLNALNYQQFNERFCQELADFDLRCADNPDNLFQREAELEGDWLVAFAIDSLELNILGDDQGKARILGRVEVYDPLEDSVVFSQTFNHRTDILNNPVLYPTLVYRAFREAVYNLVNDTGFAHALDVATRPETRFNAQNVDLTLEREPAPLFWDRAKVFGYASERTVSIQITANQHGSGFIVSNDGYILTAWHVVKNRERVRVHLPSGLQLPGRIVGWDERTDVALLKVDGWGWSPFAIAQNPDMAVGMDVYAVGTPRDLELERTITSGVVSAIRYDEDREDLRLIQTDVSVSPGNSGGPLLNARGEVVGIMVSKVIEEGYEGLGFAVPVHDALEALGITLVSPAPSRP